MLSIVLLWLLAAGDSYDAIHRELAAHYGDWLTATNDPKFPKLLDRAWRTIGEHTAAFLAAHPHASPSEVKAEIESLNGNQQEGEYQLRAAAVRLGDDAYAVSARYERTGTFFVVAGGRVRWNIKDLAARHVKRRDEISGWNWIDFSWGAGPLVGEVKALPPGRNGHPRFYVDATEAVAAGGTWPSQISIWEWNGREAVPLLVRSYSISFETPAVTLAGDTLTIPTKGRFKSFSTCGQCVEPEVIWTLRVTPDGVRDLGRVHKVPELQVVDELFDRVIHHKSTRDLAAPGVAKVMRGIQELDMLGAWSVSAHGNRRVLDFGAIALDDTTLRFEMEQRPRGLYVVSVVALPKPHVALRAPRARRFDAGSRSSRRGSTPPDARTVRGRARAACG